MCLSSNIDLLIRWRSTLFLLSASRSSRPSWYWHRHIPDYYYSTVRCRYRYLPLRRDTNITTTEPWITVPWHWCTKRLQATPRGDSNFIKILNKSNLKSISCLNEVLYIYLAIYGRSLRKIQNWERSLVDPDHRGIRHRVLTNVY